MSALSPDDLQAMQNAMQAGSHYASRSAGAFGERWGLLHEQAVELATHAQIAGEPDRDWATNIADTYAAASDWQQELAWTAIEDIDALMQPGLTALRTISARGQDVSAPALALWREFHSARTALLAIIEPVACKEAAGAA